ncbi:hypothetical protein [Roseovarius sp. C03]|uniref:hypothetical protein n=1 Tax=Roseovarius sp. C03 TaxID=3449222 RepID=UPI003EDB6D12
MHARIFSNLTLCLGLVVASVSNADACTRVVYLGPEERILTGRTMDWKLPIISNLWSFPRGIKRNG